MTAIDTHSAAAREFGGDPAAFANILAAASYSRHQIAKARAALGALTQHQQGVAALAIGSIGRYEALEASDVDFALLYDPDRANEPAASSARSAMMDLLKGAGFKDISEKTFVDPMDVSSLLADVGGKHDTNINLTYRALILTEAAWLYNVAEGRALAERIINVYQSGLSTRGRFLTSLSNDLHRYYRTLCVDYRFKIEQQNKGWAIRNMKLRHSRKLWHLANLCLQCAAASKDSVDEHDGMLAQHLSEPPLLKLVTAMREIGGVSVCADVWTLYDNFLGLIRDKGFRGALDSVEYAQREQSAEFTRIRDNATAFDDATQRVIEHLLEEHKPFVIRFGIL